MITQNEFITMSLDLNLFFLRIMKEHSLFLALGFTPRDKHLMDEAKEFSAGFEKLLVEATNLAHGNVSRDAVYSQQFVTPYTADAEKLTSFYTGVRLNTHLTREESELSAGHGKEMSGLEREVYNLNRKAYGLTGKLAEFKTKLLEDVLSCRMFTFNYPLLIKHILREARMFMSQLVDLGNRKNIMTPEELLNQEIFWNRQMAEHAKFIAGLLDPTEETLINTARMFGKEFDDLTAESKEATHHTLEIAKVTEENIEATKRLKDFKTAGTKGLLDCKIQSIIVPLLADHVLREANHYLCIMGVCNLK